MQREARPAGQRSVHDVRHVRRVHADPPGGDRTAARAGADGPGVGLLGTRTDRRRAGEACARPGECPGRGAPEGLPCPARKWSRPPKVRRCSWPGKWRRYVSRPTSREGRSVCGAGDIRRLGPGRCSVEPCIRKDGRTMGGGQPGQVRGVVRRRGDETSIHCDEAVEFEVGETTPVASPVWRQPPRPRRWRNGGHRRRSG